MKIPGENSGEFLSSNYERHSSKFDLHFSPGFSPEFLPDFSGFFTEGVYQDFYRDFYRDFHRDFYRNFYRIFPGFLRTNFYRINWGCYGSVKASLCLHPPLLGWFPCPKNHQFFHGICESVCTGAIPCVRAAYVLAVPSSRLAVRVIMQEHIFVRWPWACLVRWFDDRMTDISSTAAARSGPFDSTLVSCLW